MVINQESPLKLINLPCHIAYTYENQELLLYLLHLGFTSFPLNEYVTILQGMKNSLPFDCTKKEGVFQTTNALLWLQVFIW